ncbi:spherulation-specific family 4 protein [Streptomyces sp. JNUCC 64]
MPHLTYAPRGVPVTGTGPGVGVPAHARPLAGPAGWEALARTSAPLHWAVLDLPDGPGDRPDPRFAEAVARLAGAGVRVLGHLAADRGRAPLSGLLDRARRYRDRYRVGGYFLGGCPVDRAGLPTVWRAVDGARSLLDDAHVVLGHGRHPHPDYAEVADQLVTFSGAWCDYRWSQAAEWTADHPPERFCHLVHGVPRGHLDEALRIARWQGAGTVWFTDRPEPGETGAVDGPTTGSPEDMPGYWDEIVSRIGTGVSE